MFQTECGVGNLLNRSWSISGCPRDGRARGACDLGSRRCRRATTDQRTAGCAWRCVIGRVRPRSRLVGRRPLTSRRSSGSSRRTAESHWRRPRGTSTKSWNSSSEETVSADSSTGDVELPSGLEPRDRSRWRVGGFIERGSREPLRVPTRPEHVSLDVAMVRG